MNKLQEFLIQTDVSKMEQEINLGGRLKNHPLKIKPVSGEDVKQLQRMCTTTVKGVNTFDSTRFNEQVILKCLIDPNLRDKEMIDAVGVHTPEELLYRVFLAGEIATIATNIMDISGFNSDLQDDIDQIKNS